MTSNPDIKQFIRSKGVTLTEVLVVVAIIGILASIAIPSFIQILKQQRVEGAAEGLVAAMQNAKAEAIKRNANVSLVFSPNNTNTDNSTWCYGMTGAGQATCDCTVSNCSQSSSVGNSDFNGVTVNFNTSASRVFNPLRGTVTAGTILFSGGDNLTLGVTTTTLGRIRICKATGSTITSYKDSGACP